MRGRAAAIGIAALLVLAACSGDDGGTESADSTGADSSTTTAPMEPFRILVANDDGYDAPGLDALVEGLLTLEDAEITVFAPLEQQSGTSDESTPGEVPTSDEVTPSGYPVTAVDGFPADSIEAGLATMDMPPHLVVSGINSIQNLGPFVDESGTVGAARTGARAGIPALAVSQGFLAGDDPPGDYPTGVALTLEWIGEHRGALAAAEPVDGVAEVANLNTPTCPTGEVGELLELPVATAAQIEGVDIGAVNCEAEVTDPPHDVAGFLAGHPVLSELTA